jgi:translation initiation factor eIF-2B subunit alpha
MTAIHSDFLRFMDETPDAGIAVAAVRALTAVIRRSTASTMLGLTIELRAAADELKQEVGLNTTISITAATELFLRYVTRTALDFNEDFDACKKVLIERGEKFALISSKSKKRIAENGRAFIRDGSLVLTHAYSRVVLELLLKAAENKNFKVYVTEGRPDCAGYITASKLAAMGIPVELILDSSVAALMDKVDVCIVGAEGVLENGGIVNKVGTYQIALIAKAHNKPMYVAAEAHKFVRLFPLSQNDSPHKTIPLNPFPINQLTGEASTISLSKVQTNTNPSSDLTPPSLISLLFTDLGVLTPSAVSDELIKLYQ